MTNPQDAPDARGKRMTLTREQVEAWRAYLEEHEPKALDLVEMALLALEAEVVLEGIIEHYAWSSVGHIPDEECCYQCDARRLLQKLRGGV